MTMYYAIIWRANEPDETFDAKQFEDRLPRLLEWLRDLKSKNVLGACGGGGFETHMGGLTVVRASSATEAEALVSGDPMLEIGTHEIFEWHVFYADLVDHAAVEKLTAQ